MKYTIKRNGNTIVTVQGTGELNRKIMAEEIVNMSFVLPKYIAFKLGDSVEVFGNTYYLNQTPIVEKVSTLEFRYQLQFEGIKYELAKIQVLFPDKNNELTIPDFSVMGNAEKILKLLVKNANRINSGWTMGACESTETKNLTFTTSNILSALATVAETFGLEYWVDGDRSIHLKERKEISLLQLEYGKAKGLRSINRATLEGSNVITRLYAIGSTTNIANDYRNGSKRLKMPVAYLEKNTDIYGTIEHTEIFEDIYPHRTGKVTAVYENPLLFSDSSIDFDLNGMAYDDTPIILPKGAKISFKTGLLEGYTFELQQHGYNSTTKTFTLLKNKDEDTTDVPSKEFKMAVGDEYVITDIVMPQSYITNAELELQAKATEYLDKNSHPRFIYSALSDSIYFEKQNIDLQLGNTVKFVDADFGLDSHIRVTSIVKNLQNPYDVKFELAEQITQPNIVRQYIANTQKEQALIDVQKAFDDSIRRNYNFTREIHENVFDSEGYFDAEKIKPLSIETKMLSVGSRLQQFTLQDVALIVATNASVKNTAGKLIHYTLEDKPRTWNLPANTFTGINNGFNFIYVKAQKVGNNASIFVSKDVIKVDEDNTFYFFELGYLSSVENGFRKIRLTNGFTSINGREITTGKIQSPSGKGYFDIDTGEIEGKITFSNDSPAKIEINKQIDDIQVGGRNLFINSAVNSGLTGSDAPTLCKRITMDGVQRLERIEEGRMINYWGRLTERIQGEVIEDGSELVVSFDAKSNAINGVVYLDFRRTPIKRATINSDEKWERYSLVFDKRINDNEKKNVLLALVINSNVIGEYIEIKNVKIERGNKPTDWTPAPEDVETKIINIDEASKAVAKAEAKLAEERAKAEASNLVSEEQQRAIKDAEEKLKEAKKYADKAESKANAEIAKINLATSELQKQIDNEVSNWFFPHTPTLQNIPAKDWRTREELKRHIGDTFTNTEDASKPNSGKSYRFVEEAGVFKWIVIKDSDAIKALQEASKAQATADGKSTTYLAKPNKYEKGDSWILERDYTLNSKSYKKGTLLQATENSRTFVERHWAEAVRYTDDTAVNNIQIGGRNLMLNTSLTHEGKGAWEKLPAKRIEDNYLCVAEKYGWNINYIIPFLAKGTYTISVTAKEGLNEKSRVRIANSQNLIPKQGIINKPLTSDWNKYSLTFTLEEDVENFSLFFLNGDNTEGNALIYFREFKLEKGNKATDYTVAPEDIDKQIETVKTEVETVKLLTEEQKKETENVKQTTEKLSKKTDFLTTTIDGNVVATGTVVVGDANGNPKAGITGTASRKIQNRIKGRSVTNWAGSTYAERENAPLQIWDDGKLIARDAIIKGHIEAESGSFKGHVEAESGSFKGHIEAESGSFKGHVEAESGSFKGHIEAESGKIASFNINSTYIESTHKDGQNRESSLKIGAGSLEYKVKKDNKELGFFKVNAGEEVHQGRFLVHLKALDKDNLINPLLIEIADRKQTALLVIGTTVLTDVIIQSGCSLKGYKSNAYFKEVMAEKFNIQRQRGINGARETFEGIDRNVDIPGYRLIFKGGLLVEVKRRI